MAHIHRLARWTLAAMWGLIGAGSLVTTTGSGLSIPDWPTAFGGLVPTRWEGGVVFEYGHRVIAGIVLTLVTVLWIRALRTPDLRVSVRRGITAVWVLIMIQAVLGGVTVLLELPTVVSVAHAGLAQITFATMVACAVITAPSWPPRTTARTPAGTQRRWWPWAGLLVVLTFGQILLGAWMRHIAAGLAVPTFPLAYGRLWPPAEMQFDAVKIWAHMLHRYGGLFLGLAYGTVTIPILRRFRSYRAVTLPARWLLIGWGIQLLLGGLVVWWTRQWTVTTLHVMTGAALFGLTVWLTLSLRAVEENTIREGTQ